MGYSEVVCRLCGVSFNIGRRRLRSEPAWTGWRCTGDAKQVGCQLGKGRDPNVCFEDDDEDECGEPEGDDEEDGTALEDMDEDEGISEISTAIKKMLDGEGDEDYLFEESDMEEPLEFESDEEIVDEEEEDLADIDLDAQDELYTLFQKSLLSRYDTEVIQALAKHKCFRGAGYDGKNITAEEMRGCNDAQCIVSKRYPSANNEEPDDQEYEREGQFCLTGLCGHVRSRDCGGEDLWPIRHGVIDPIMDSIVRPVSFTFVVSERWAHLHEESEYGQPLRDRAVPFHTTCFDIFTRLSRQRFGYVNFEALGLWIFDTIHLVDIDSVDPNVRKSATQFWKHSKGCEYLAANPLFIPRLAPILRAAVDEDPNFAPSNGAFEVPFHSESCDVFSNLPVELRLQTLSYLASADIANLRLASRTFRQLPILLWRQLLLKEMPFLWEVWSNDIPYIWATTTYDDAVKYDEEEDEIGLWCRRAGAIIRDNLPEIFDAWDADVTKMWSQRAHFREAGQAAALEEIVTGLPPFNTNWYKLYLEITKNWKELKGLQNRRRIWKDIGVVVKQLDRYTNS